MRRVIAKLDLSCTSNIFFESVGCMRESSDYTLPWLTECWQA